MFRKTWVRIRSGCLGVDMQVTHRDTFHQANPIILAKTVVQTCMNIFFFERDAYRTRNLRLNNRMWRPLGVAFVLLTRG